MPKNAYGFEIAPPTFDMAHTVSPPATLASADYLTMQALPVGPSLRLNSLSGKVADDDAIAHGLATRLVDLTEGLQRARVRLSQIKSRFRVDESHPEQAAATAAVANATEDLARLNARIDAHHVTAGPRRELLKNVTAWLRSTTVGHDLVDLGFGPPELKGETHEVAVRALEAETTAAVEKVRRRVRELDADRRRIEASPFPSSYAKQLAAQHINALAEAGAPHVDSLIEFGGALIVDGAEVEPAIVWPSKTLHSKVTTIAGDGTATAADAPDVIGILAWLFKDQMLKRLGASIDAASDDKAALTWEQRRTQLAAIASDKEAAELEEARLIWGAFTYNIAIEWRADMTPSRFLLAKTVEANRPAPYDHAEAITQAQRALRQDEAQP